MAKYIVRLDDACPTMNRKKWDMYEEVLDDLKIKPIVAVIPNNKDSSLHYNEEDKLFWNKVKRWQEKGWHIALHGYDHKYISKGSGIVPLNKRSEFVGLSLEEQRSKIREGWQVLNSHNINCDIWVAPSHTFDENTLIALKEETNISIVSDGLAFYPFNRFGFFWIPQQLWRFTKMPKGIYTICYHPSNKNEKQISDELHTITENSTQFISDFKILKKIYADRQLSIVDILYEKYFFIKKNSIEFMIKMLRKK